MAFMVARTEKRKVGSLGGYQNHVDRKTDNHSNKDIDNSKTHLNYDLVGHETDKSFHKEFMDYINENRVGSRAVRKDAVVMQDWIIGSSQEFFDALTPEDTRKYFETAVEFFAEKFGRENIRFATVHMDEKTPHMHMGIVPLKDGKLTAKTIFDRNCLRMIQDKLPQAFQKAGFDIQRGEPKSEKVHLQPDEFKATMRAAEEKAMEIKREARKQAEEHVEWRENIEAKNLSEEWKDEWLETKEVFPDFSMKIEVYEEDTVPRFVNVDENTPKTFKFDFEEILNLFKEKFARLKAYIAFKWQDLSRKETEIEKRENTLIEKETSLEGKLEGIKEEIGFQEGNLENIKRQKNIALARTAEFKELAKLASEVQGKLGEKEPDIKIKEPMFGEKTVTMPYAKYERMRIANWDNPFAKAYDDFHQQTSGMVAVMAKQEEILEERVSDLRKENSTLKKEKTSLSRESGQYLNDYIDLNNVVVELMNEDKINETDLAKYGDKLPQAFIDDYSIPVPEKSSELENKIVPKGPTMRL